MSIIGCYEFPALLLTPSIDYLAYNNNTSNTSQTLRIVITLCHLLSVNITSVLNFKASKDKPRTINWCVHDGITQYWVLSHITHSIHQKLIWPPIKDILFKMNFTQIKMKFFLPTTMLQVILINSKEEIR